MAEALFQSIRMQLSVPRYRAIAPERGANLDMIDLPLNNRGWLVTRFAEIRKLADERERSAAIDEMVNWTNPGPGGFYDDLGDTANSAHLVKGLGFALDPTEADVGGAGIDRHGSEVAPMVWMPKMRMKSKCPGMEAKLALLLLDPAAAPAKVQTHVAECDRCQAELAELQATMALLDTWEAPEPSLYFMTRMNARMREEREAAPAGWLASRIARMRAGSRPRPSSETAITTRSPC